MRHEHREALRENLRHIGFEPPATYERIGDVLILSLPDRWEAHESEIGQAYRDVFHVQAVMKKGRISEEFRLPSYTLIAGDSTVTTHRENGILYSLDVASLMFSAGNIGERSQMARLPKGERVIDMFAGIGYFSLPIAKFCSSSVVALEKNPISYSFLCENVRLNRLDGLVSPRCMDCRDYEGKADRVIMGYFGASAFLGHAFSFVEEGVVHYHDAVPEPVLTRPIEELRRQAERDGKKMEILDFRKVKQFSPGVWHVCAEAFLHP